MNKPLSILIVILLFLTASGMLSRFANITTDATHFIIGLFCGLVVAYVGAGK